MLESLDRSVGTTPQLCREDHTGKPCSALTWLPFEEPVLRVEGRGVELNDLVEGCRNWLLSEATIWPLASVSARFSSHSGSVPKAPNFFSRSAIDSQANKYVKS